MLQHDWIVGRLAQEHRRDLLQQAEQERLARQVRPTHSQGGHSVYHALDLLGRQLIVLGEHLRASHTAVHARSMTHTSRG